MKRILSIALCLCMVPIFGCQTATSTTPPAVLAPGYINAADQQMGQILSGARTFYSTIQCETKAMNWSQTNQQCVADPAITSPMTLTSTEKTAFNDFGVSLNAANTVYLAYHNGTATQAAAQAAVNTVQQKQQALPILAVTK